MTLSHSPSTSTHDPSSCEDGQHTHPHFPKGQCRYILTTPGLTGKRCACLGFRHNVDVPGSACDCGHMSCFHITSSREEHEASTSNNEVETLKQRVASLEKQTDDGEHGSMVNLMSRVSHLEEMLQSAQEETQAEIKGSYQSVNNAWGALTQLQKRVAMLDSICRRQSEQLERAGKELLDLRNRQLELLDSDESLEERIERLEGGEITAPTSRAVSRRGSLLAPSVPSGTLLSVPSGSVASDLRRSRSSTTRPSTTGGRAGRITDISEAQTETPQLSAPAGPWTVHVSLVLSREQQFPFEKDSTAYKRCLSRGLHRMVVVGGPEASSFISAVSMSFQGLLDGRPWEPLQAKVPDGSKPQELAVLRPLDANLLGKEYDAQFLKRHCAVCDSSGRMDSIYITLRHGKLEWDFVQQQPIYLEGLESAWHADEAVEAPDSKGRVSGAVAGNASTKTAADGTKRDDAPHTIVSAESLTKRRASIGYVEAESPQSKVARMSCQPERIELLRGVWTSL